MSKIEDGGPAYPQITPFRIGPDDKLLRNTGMSLRDWFAGQALAGLCGNSGGPFQASPFSGWGLVNCGTGDVARWSYVLADAMLAARQEQS